MKLSLNRVTVPLLQVTATPASASSPRERHRIDLAALALRKDAEHQQRHGADHKDQLRQHGLRN